MNSKYGQLLKLFLVLPILMGALTGCKKDEAADTSAKTYYYDPRIPFGNIDLNTSKIQNVQNLQADVSVLQKIKLTWKIPPLYKTLTHKVYIYKRREPPADFNIVCPRPAGEFFSMCPADEASGAPLYLYKELNAEELLDQNTIDANGDEINNVDIDMGYSYWVFMKVNDNDWSSGVRINVRSKTSSTEFELPIASKFWEFKRWGLGFDPLNNNSIQFLQSMNAGDAIPGQPRGGISLAYSGNVLYFADTDNNRVLIYARDGALSCEQYTDEYEKSACQLQYIGAPMVVQNVLGQPSGTTTYACGEAGALPNNECLTKPTKVSVIGNRLYISDSGNNRIVVYNHLPLDGCVQDNGSGVVKPRDCTPNSVIGKQGLMDLSSYNLASTGQAILKEPTDVVAKDGALFIADTGHNRIVRIDNYADPDYFNCTPDTWGGPLCQFDGLLGQEDYYFDKTFDSMVTADPTIILQSGIKDTIRPADANILKRYFRRPTRIVFTDDDKMLISANEQFVRPNAIGGFSSLQSRILVFNENPIRDEQSSCNPGTFAVGECDADDIIGQARVDKLETVGDTSFATYNQLSYGLFSVDDFDLVTLPPAEGADAGSQLLMAVSSISNEVYIWNNWVDKTADGYPKSAKAVDPQSAPHPSTGQLMPDLKSLCAIRISLDSSNIYISDCGGHRVYEITATDYTN